MRDDERVAPLWKILGELLDIGLLQGRSLIALGPMPAISEKDLKESALWLLPRTSAGLSGLFHDFYVALVGSRVKPINARHLSHLGQVKSMTNLR